MPNPQTPLRLRNKMMGVMLQDARKASGQTVRDAAQAAGLSSGILLAFEGGRKSITLPELEALAYCYDVSARHLLSGTHMHADEKREKVDVTRWTQIRQKMIATRLRQLRADRAIKLGTLSARTGITSRRITAYENGAKPIPLPELESLANALQAEAREFLEYQGPIGTWEKERESLELFDQLPVDLQEFVSQPINEPYLRLAMRLSQLPVRRLREIAEALLDITL
jgi:transcriptional regulator with XRE-family HTH domain